MPQTDNILPLRQFETTYLGFLSAMEQNDAFEGLVAEIPAPAGFVDYGDVFPMGEFEDATPGIMATINRIRGVTKQLITKNRRLTAGIDEHVFRNTNARMPGSLTGIAQKLAMATFADRQKKLTALIVTPGKGFMADSALGSGNDADFFKATDKFLPFTDKAFKNADSADSTSTAAVFRKSILDRIAIMSEYPNTLNGFVNQAPDDGPAFVVMIPPILFSLAVDAFGNAPGGTVVGLNQIDTVVQGFSVRFRINPNLGAESAAVAGAKWYVFGRNTAFKPFVLARQYPTQYRQTNTNDSHTITFGEMLMQSYYGEEVGYDSDFVAYKQTDN